MSDDRFAVDLAYEHDLTLAQGRASPSSPCTPLDPMAVVTTVFRGIQNATM